MNPTIIVGLLGALVTLLGVSFGLLKLRPERQSIIAQAAEHAVKAMEGSLTTLRQELTETKKEMTETKKEIARVLTELEAANLRIIRLMEREAGMVKSIESVERRLEEGRENAVAQVLDEIAKLRRDLQTPVSPTIEPPSS